MNAFINRKKETENLRLHIKNKHIETYGYTGVGKTAFLHFICNRIIPRELSSEEYCTIHVRLQQVGNFKELIGIIANKLNDTFEREKFFFECIEYIYESDNYNDEIAINYFRPAFSVLINTIKIILCLDGTEKVPLELWEQFEEKILRIHLGVIENQPESRLKLIIAGQWRTKWNFLPMRAQLEPYRLDLFDKESTREMFQLLVDSKKLVFNKKEKNVIIDAIYRLTIGHPKSIELIVERWTNNYTQPLDGYDIAQKYKNNNIPKEDIDFLIDKFIQPKFIEHSNGLTEGEHYPDSKTLFFLLQYLAPLRFISSKILRKTLSNLSSISSFYNKRPSFFFNKLFGILQEGYFLDWNDAKEQYEFPAIIRHILLEDLKARDCGMLIELHQEIESMYKKEIQESFVKQNIFFTEQLYHIVSWQTLDNDKSKGNYDIEETLRNKIDNYLREYGGDSASLRTLLETDDYFEKMTNWKRLFNSLKKIN